MAKVSLKGVGKKKYFGYSKYDQNNENNLRWLRQLAIQKI